MYNKYFNEVSVLHIFLKLDIRGINDIRLISKPIHAPSHELEDTDTNTPLIKVVNKRCHTYKTSVDGRLG